MVFNRTCRFQTGREVSLLIFASFGLKILGLAGLDEPAWLVMLLGCLFMATIVMGMSLSATITFSYRLVKGILLRIFKTKFTIFNKIVSTIPALIFGFIVFAILFIGMVLLFLMF